MDGWSVSLQLMRLRPSKRFRLQLGHQLSGLNAWTVGIAVHGHVHGGDEQERLLLGRIWPKSWEYHYLTGLYKWAPQHGTRLFCQLCNGSVFVYSCNGYLEDSYYTITMQDNLLVDHNLGYTKMMNFVPIQTKQVMSQSHRSDSIF